ncbi:MAG: phosphonate metabolism protein/1,5-bisphosphokinase (PRPP-forming) PhnN [Candidatus Odyssella sp.]|nr:phosphonate metabolism protein/1,5-bisphosphokinase (PRPP-forming) PhnN [Candidatus Odyssella sp.]
MPASRPTLVYVMGPAGAGKDSVLRYARERLGGRYPVAFAHRYITRPRGTDIEDYIALSPSEFALRQRRGLFAFDWSAYGFRYGIGVEIRAWRAAGLIVVVDGSRAHFARHAARLRGVLPVLVTVDEAELRRRLIRRGREGRAAIERRLRRARSFAPAHAALVTIDNSGPLEAAGDRFCRLLRACAAAK